MAEIEITKEMLEAGEEAFRFRPDFEDLSDALERAYRAMRAAESNSAADRERAARQNDLA